MRSKKLPKDLLDKLIRACRQNRKLCIANDDAWCEHYDACIAYAQRIEQATGQSWLGVLHVVEAALSFNPKATNQDIYDVFLAMGLQVTE